MTILKFILLKLAKFSNHLFHGSAASCKKNKKTQPIETDNVGLDTANFYFQPRYDFYTVRRYFLKAKGKLSAD